MLFQLIIPASIFAIALLPLLLFASPISNQNEINYLVGRRIVETIPFNDLQTSTCSDGTELKVTPAAEYPEDKMVEYKSVVFPVENHDGKSVVVATYVLRNAK